MLVQKNARTELEIVSKIVILNSVATAFTNGGPKTIHAIKPISKSHTSNIDNFVFLPKFASFLGVVFLMELID